MLKKDRIIRKKRIRSKLSGDSKRPRVSVFRSNRYIYAQAVDDSKGKTIAYVSGKEIKEGTGREKARKIGELLAEQLAKLKIKEIVFDRSGYKFHGRIQAVAEGLKEKGVKI